MTQPVMTQPVMTPPERRPASFGTAINCMDGRVIRTVERYCQARFGVEHVDQPTDAGPVRHLADPESAPAAVERLLGLVDVSVKQHGSSHIALVAHEACAGNPLDEATQLRQLWRGVAFLRERYDDAEVIGLWVYNQDDEWLITDLSQSDI